MQPRIDDRQYTFLVGAALAGVCVTAFGAAVHVHAQQGGGPPGSIVFFSARDTHANNQIYRMDPDGGNQVRVTDDTASDVDPDISPNGKEILFTSNAAGNNDIFVLDGAGAVANLTGNPAIDEWAHWSPDGKKILFGSNRTGGVFEIYVMNADGSGLRRLTDPPVLSRYGSWSPDGKQIAFRHGIDIYVMDADGSGAPVQLTHEAAPSFAQMPVYSPDGQSIAFMSVREGYCSIFVMSPDGSGPDGSAGPVNLTPQDPSDPQTKTQWCSKTPAWSANGHEIFFTSFRPSTAGQNEVFVTNSDGSDLRQLTSDGVSGSPRAR